MPHPTAREKMLENMLEKENKKRPNPTDIHVGSRIRMRRNILGMSQEKLGESLGITFQQIQKYEKGTNRVGASRLQAIASILDVPVAFFFAEVPGRESALDGLSDGDGSRFVMDFVNSGEGLQLNRAFARIADAKVRRKVVELVKALASEESD
jgi:transcriptional regulator with XRE-family HTH domain